MTHKHALLPQLCAFAGVSYGSHLADALHDRSTTKRNRLGNRDAEYVDRFCTTVYDRARGLRTIGAE